MRESVKVVVETPLSSLHGSHVSGPRRYPSRHRPHSAPLAPSTHEALPGTSPPRQEAGCGQRKASSSSPVESGVRRYHVALTSTACCFEQSMPEDGQSRQLACAARGCTYLRATG